MCLKPPQKVGHWGGYHIYIYICIYMYDTWLHAKMTMTVPLFFPILPNHAVVKHADWGLPRFSVLPLPDCPPFLDLLLLPILMRYDAPVCVKLYIDYNTCANTCLVRAGCLRLGSRLSLLTVTLQSQPASGRMTPKPLHLHS